MTGKWKDINREHVIKAIQKYDEEGIESYSRNTFLLYNNKKYPAKHIRAMAYEVAFNEPADKSKFTGGKETVNFFENLGFTVDYKGNGQEKHERKLNNKKDQVQKKKMSHRGVVEQKNFLQLHLNKYFEGDVVSEKTYDWLKTPDMNNYPNEYDQIINALQEYRGNINIGKSNYKLRCDFVCESQKIIIEYDERQHFTKARQISLSNYPEDIKLNFNKVSWMNSCESIGAKDNHPHNRDEVRAFYDSVRDIETSKHGYRLIRIKHGDYDWESKDGQKYLKKIIGPNGNTLSSDAKLLDVEDNYDWRSLEIEIQRIRLAYLKWLYHFNPKPSEALETMMYNEKLYIIGSPYGRSFSLSPAGVGGVYAGGGKGVAKLPQDSYGENLELKNETERIKASIDRKVKQLKRKIELFIKYKNYPRAWEYLQNFWWLRLGLHEYAYDVYFQSSPLPEDDVRDHVLVSMYNKFDLSIDPPTIFTDEQLLHSLRYKFSWNRYGVCSYDCGPLAIGKKGFVPYREAAQRIKKYFKENADLLPALETLNQKRDFAASSLEELYDFQILYHRQPLGFYLHDSFEKNKEDLRKKIIQVEKRLHEIIDEEDLNVG